MKDYFFRSLYNNNHVVTGKLVAKYSIEFTNLSYFDIETMIPECLFELWLEEARKSSKDGYVNIEWLVDVEGQRFKPEYMPGQFGLESDFLDHFSLPLDVKTGKPIVWHELNVESPKSIFTGDFIEEVTGWKPSILQTNVSINFLIEKAKQKSEVA